MVIKKKKSYLWSKCIEKICLFSHLVHHVKILFDFETLIKKKCCRTGDDVIQKIFRYWSMLTIICFYRLIFLICNFSNG